jgi:Amidase
MTWQLDATALSALLDARDITPVQLLDQALARLDALEPVLNAFTHVDRDGAAAAAKAASTRQASGARLSPLDGIPVSVKDNIFVVGLPARWGSLLFRDFIPDRDDICVERLRAAGAINLAARLCAEAKDGQIISFGLPQPDQAPRLFVPRKRSPGLALGTARRQIRAAWPWRPLLGFGSAPRRRAGEFGQTPDFQKQCRGQRQINPPPVGAAEPPKPQSHQARRQ